MRYLVRTIGEPEFGGEDPTLRNAAIWFLREVAREVLAGVDRVTASRRDEPDVREWLTGYLRGRRSVLDWTDADAPGEVLLAAARVDCFDLLPEVYAAVEPLLTTRAPALRGCAALTAATLSGHPDLVAHRPRLLAYHLTECASADAHYRASMLLGVGELGGSPRAWLRDPHPGVRVCAALAPALADDPDANTVLLAEHLHLSPRTVEKHVASLLTDAGLVPAASGEVDCPFVFPDLPTAWRGQASIGPFRWAIEAAGEDLVYDTYAEALAPYRQPDGSYRQDNVFRYVIAGRPSVRT